MHIVAHYLVIHWLFSLSYIYSSACFNFKEYNYATAHKNHDRVISRVRPGNGDDENIWKLNGT